MRLYSRLRDFSREWLPRLEFEIIVTVFALAVSSFAFLKLASEMLEGETHAIDQAILQGLRDPVDPQSPIGPPWIEIMFVDLTSLGGPSVLALITAISIGYLWVDGKRSAALFLALAVGAGAVLAALLKLGFARPRPDLVSHLVEVNSYSFPSGHATMATIVYLTLGVVLARAQARRRMKGYVLLVAVALAVIVGFSRVYLGVHWPTDVLAGWCVGASWAIACLLVETLLQRRGAIERASDAGANERHIGGGI